MNTDAINARAVSVINVGILPFTINFCSGNSEKKMHSEEVCSQIANSCTNIPVGNGAKKKNS